MGLEVHGLKRILAFAAATFLAAPGSLALAQAPPPELSYAFRFQPRPEPRLAVEARFRGGPAGFTVLGWCLSRWLDAPGCGQAVTGVTVHSGSTGELLPLDRPEPNIWTCDHKPGEPLIVQYDLAPPASAAAETTALVPTVSAEYVMFLGDAGLLVPEHLVRPAPTAIHYAWEGPLPAGWTAATSFAVEEREKTVHLPVKAFLQSLFFWGAVQVDETPSPVGPPLRVAWLRTAPVRGEGKALSARLLAVREAVARHIEVDRTATWFVLPSVPGRVSALTLTASILLLTDAGTIAGAAAPWALTAAHEVVHTGPTGRIKLADAPVPANFLNEALAELLARRALYRAGLIGTQDWADAVSVKLSRQTAGPADPYVTGDLLMLLLDAEIRRVSAGKADILRLIQELLQRPRQERGTEQVAWSDFRRSLAALTSPSFAEEVDGLLQQGRAVRLSGDLFAGCLRVTEAPIWAFDAGFDVERSIQAKRVQGVRRGGAAWLAGLRDGETLLEWSVQWNRADVPVRFQVAAGGEPRSVSYLPRGDRVLGSRQELVPEPESRRCGDLL